MVGGRCLGMRIDRRGGVHLSEEEEEEEEEEEVFRFE